MSKSQHNYYFGLPSSFIVFNDEELSMEQIEPRDIEAIEIPAVKYEPFASAAWSSGVEWFFVVQPDCIVLLNTSSNNGLRCAKKSGRFIGAFLDNQPPTTDKGKLGSAPCATGVSDTI